MAGFVLLGNTNPNEFIFRLIMQSPTILKHHISQASSLF